MQSLLEKANSVYLKNFKADTWFERAVFFSWYCAIKDCAFCYMSTQKHKDKIAKRTDASILAEVLLCKKLGWHLGFFSGGINAYTSKGFKEILEKVYKVYGKKVWINIGALSKQQLEDYKPFVEGTVASVEVINPKIHKRVCPSKPLKPYEDMLKNSLNLNMKTAMTIIVGLGETREDFKLLKDFIKKYKISKIHFYGLNPQKGTIFENKASPTKEEQAWWIAQTRINFPSIDIQFGIWVDRVDRVAYLLKAGANSISKFPATSKFNSKYAKNIEKQAKLADRKFHGTLTKMPEINWNREVDILNLEKEEKEKIKIKLAQYIRNMS